VGDSWKFQDMYFYKPARAAPDMLPLAFMWDFYVLIMMWVFIIFWQRTCVSMHPLKRNWQSVNNKWVA